MLNTIILAFCLVAFFPELSKFLIYITNSHNKSSLLVCRKKLKKREILIKFNPKLHTNNYILSHIPNSMHPEMLEVLSIFLCKGSDNILVASSVTVPSSKL